MEVWLICMMEVICRWCVRGNGTQINADLIMSPSHSHLYCPLIIVAGNIDWLQHGPPMDLGNYSWHRIVHSLINWLACSLCHILPSDYERIPYLYYSLPSLHLSHHIISVIILVINSTLWKLYSLKIVLYLLTCVLTYLTV